MKALILNSGPGTRMGKLAKDKPKCLIKINNESILERQMRILKENGVNEFIITTGPFQEQIKKMVKEKFPDVKVHFVFNDKYETASYIYSLWLSRDLIDDTIIYMHGDMVFNSELIKRLINSEAGNSVLINNKQKLWGKNGKARIVDNVVNEVSVDIFDENVYNLNQVYRLSKDFFLKWIGLIGQSLDKGEVNTNANDIMSMLIKEEKLLPCYHQESLCMEIDTLEDLEKAKKLIEETENN